MFRESRVDWEKGIWTEKLRVRRNKWIIRRKEGDTL
tara:strand:- start:592 stop:699 length:108 start_codon:yes stop_codon:yes gene_type:complete